MATYLKPLYTRTLKPNKRIKALPAQTEVRKLVNRAMPARKRVPLKILPKQKGKGSLLTPLKKKAKPNGKQWKMPLTIPGRGSDGTGVGI